MPYKERLQNVIREIRSQEEPASSSVPISNVLDLKRLVQEKEEKVKQAVERFERPKRLNVLDFLFHSNKKSVQPGKVVSSPPESIRALNPTIQKVGTGQKLPHESKGILKHSTAKKSSTPKKQEPEFFVFADEQAPRHKTALIANLFRQFKPQWSSRRSLGKKLKLEKEESAEQTEVPTVIGSKLGNRRWAPVAFFFGWSLILVVSLYAMGSAQKAKQVQEKVLGVSDIALERLKAGGAFAAGSDWDSASQEFDQALKQFSEAQAALYSLDGLLRSVGSMIPGQGKKLKSGEHLLNAGKAIAEAGSYLGEALKPFQEFDLDLIKTQDLDQPYSLTTILLLSNAQLRPAADALNAGVASINEVDLDVIPSEKREEFQSLVKYLPLLQQTVKEFIRVSDQLLVFLGHNEDRRYLFLFQNDHELRPTGGFISSFALLDMRQGQITKMDVPGGGTYDLKGWLTERVLAPEPLRLVNPHWNAQDANWWPDFPISAKKFIWFYEHSGGPSVDGVIAITPTVIEEFLKSTGPIDMIAEYGQVITAENFRAFAEEQSASQRDAEGGTPKQFIADFAPQFLNRVFSTRQEELWNTLAIFYRFLEQKHILFYLEDQEEQAAFTDFGWTGNMLSAPQDYLSIVHTNIAGGPTDGVIDHVVTHEVEVQRDGSVVVNVLLERIHRGDPDNPNQGIKNIDYVRFYVPEGSVLLDASGFFRPGQGYFLKPEQGYSADSDLETVEGEGKIHEATGVSISSAFGKTVFGHWLQVDPGSSVTASISYRLPFKLSLKNFWNRSDHYSVLFQKQAGAKPVSLTSILRFPKGISVTSTEPNQTFEVRDQEAIYHTVLETDAAVGLVLSKD